MATDRAAGYRLRHVVGAAMIAFVLVSTLAFADEGMWLPEQVPDLASRLTELGITVPADKLAEPLGAPLGAVASLGHCSTSFVSPDGLMATNHHCVGGFLQVLSDDEHDYSRDGFVARSRSDERSVGEAARVWLVERIEPVTEQVLVGVGRRTRDARRQDIVEANTKRIVANCEAADPDLRCRVAGMYGGLEYRLFVQRQIRDLRLVYAPPASVGSYGGEIDNWMWPRHSGDFSLLRAYVAPDGSSAPYASDNVPFRPERHLAVDSNGVGPGDAVMVAGFPGGTTRYRLAMELQQAVESDYPRQIAMADQVTAILERHSAADPEAAAKLHAPIGWVQNGRKLRQGVLDGFAGAGVIEARKAREADLDAWLAADRKRAKTVGAALTELRALIAAEHATAERDELVGRLMGWADLLGEAHRAYRFAVEAEKPDLDRKPGYQDRDRERALDRTRQLQRSMVLAADRDVLALVLAKAAELPADQRIAPLDCWLADQGGAEAALDRLYAAPALAEMDARVALFSADRASLETSNDPWVQLAVRMERWLAPQREVDEERAGAMLRLRPQVMAALLDWQSERLPDQPVYPDANGTLRLTFGTVEGYSPADAVLYGPQTTVAGMVAKAGPEPFDAPGRLLDAAPAAPSSRWADPALGDVPVDFLTALDTTGGNSGSPVMNADGRFVGLAFDGNYESMAADWMFLPEVTRTICVDVRYMLWVLEQEPAGGAILAELLGEG